MTTRIEGSTLQDLGIENTRSASKIKFRDITLDVLEAIVSTLQSSNLIHVR